MLTVFRCRSLEEGSIAFHRVSGAGLDIVEMDGGTIDIQDAAIRGIAVSRDPDRDRRDPLQPIRLTAGWSFLVNTYFSAGLMGSAVLDDCRVISLANLSKIGASGDGGFEVSIVGDSCQFLVNTDEPQVKPKPNDGSRPAPKKPDVEPAGDGCTQFVPTDLKQLGHDLESMDFRFRPELWEGERRHARAKPRGSGAGTKDNSRSRPDGAE